MTTRIVIPAAAARVTVTASSPARVTVPAVARQAIVQPVGRAGRDFDVNWVAATDAAIAAQATVDVEVQAQMQALDDMPDLVVLFNNALI